MRVALKGIISKFYSLTSSRIFFFQSSALERNIDVINLQLWYKDILGAINWSKISNLI